MGRSGIENPSQNISEADMRVAPDCGTDNPIAFAKLRDMLMMHLAIRERSADAVGQAQTAAIEDHIVERLKKSFPDLLGKWPPV